jgi:UDP-glucuronate decarboxylase
MKVELPKKALVTGGAGFLGSHLCRRLLSDGYEVTAIDNLFTGTKANIYDLMENRRFSFVLHDVTQPYWGQFDEIYNLACPASPVHYQHNPVETMKTSVLGMMNMLELALKTKAKVLHSSTSEVYGDPLVHPQVESYWGNVNIIGVRSCYDEGKRCAETLAADYRREYGVDVRMVRIFNTYGPNMHPQDGRVISNFIMQALNNEDITLFGDGLQTRSFQYCEDLVEAMRRYMDLPRGTVDAFCLKHALGAPVVNTGNPGEYTIRELAEETLRQIPDSRSRIVFRPLPADDPKRRKPDISLAKELLGWEPKVPLAEGLARTIEYFRHNSVV